MMVGWRGREMVGSLGGERMTKRMAERRGMLGLFGREGMTKRMVKRRVMVGSLGRERMKMEGRRTERIMTTATARIVWWGIGLLFHVYGVMSKYEKEMILHKKKILPFLFPQNCFCNFRDRLRGRPAHQERSQEVGDKRKAFLNEVFESFFKPKAISGRSLKGIS